MVLTMGVPDALTTRFCMVLTMGVPEALMAIISMVLMVVYLCR